MKSKKRNNEVITQDNNKDNLQRLNQKLTSLIEIQVTTACPIKSKQIDSIANNFINSITQKEGIETMLVGQMMATHNLAMLMLSRGGIEFQSAFPKDFKATQSAVKLLNAFTRQIEALQNYRGKTSTQKIVVEQVKVESGGQAVVGSIETKGGA